jgi:hypothetical protein
MFNGVQNFKKISNLFHIHQNPPIMDFVNLNFNQHKVKLQPNIKFQT